MYRFKRKFFIIALIAVSVAIGSFVLYFLLPVPPGLPESGIYLKVDLSLDPITKIRLDDHSVERGYPSDYRIDYPSDFFTVVLETAGGQRLFAGKVKYRNIQTAKEIGIDPTTNQWISSSEEPDIEILTRWSLNLPYYPNTGRIKILNEQNELVFQSNLTNLKLNANMKKSKLCGNGICDFKENVISCFSDCSYVFRR